HGFFDGAIDVQGDVVAIGVDVFYGFASATSVDAANNIGAGFEHQGGVFGTFTTGNTLDDDFGIFIEENRHFLAIPSLFISQLGGFVSAFVHGGCDGDQWVVGFGQ